VSGNYYLDLVGPFKTTRCPILVSGTGTLNAKDLITTSTGVNGNVAYTRAQADSRFYLNSNPSGFITGGAFVPLHSGITIDSGKFLRFAPSGGSNTGTFSYSGDLLTFDKRLSVQGDSTFAGALRVGTIGGGGLFIGDPSNLGGAIDANGNASFLNGAFSWNSNSNLTVALPGGIVCNNGISFLDGRIYSVSSPTPSMLFNIGTDNNFAIQAPVSLEDGISFASVNDDNSANASIEFRATQFQFTVVGPNATFLIDSNGNLSLNGGAQVLNADGTWTLGGASYDGSLVTLTDTNINGKLTVKHAGGAPVANSDTNATAVFDNGGNACNVWLNVPTAAHGGTDAGIGITVEGDYKAGIKYSIPNGWIALTPQGGNTASAVTQGLFVTSGGNVGVGTSTPTQRLDVSGIVRCSGVICQSGNAATATAGQIIFTSGHFYGYVGTGWKQLDN
jgi:hypothetical protein